MVVALAESVVADCDAGCMSCCAVSNVCGGIGCDSNVCGGSGCELCWKGDDIGGCAGICGWNAICGRGGICMDVGIAACVGGKTPCIGGKTPCIGSAAPCDGRTKAEAAAIGGRGAAASFDCGGAAAVLSP